MSTPVSDSAMSALADAVHQQGEDRRVAIAHLRLLVRALDGAFISSWQSTHAWQKELDDAREWLNQLEGATNDQA